VAISLTKGQGISLEKEAPGMTSVLLGAGWGMKDKKGFFGGIKKVSVDLDASALLFDSMGTLVDSVWFRQLESNDGSVVHTGDDLTGGGNANDPNEEIRVNLKSMDTSVQTLVFTINSFSGDSFEGIPDAFCTLRDSSSKKEIARYSLSTQGGNWTALIIAKLVRGNNGWEFKALGEWDNGRTFEQLLPRISGLL
jgi:tellurium resistance protein TerZ